MQQACNTDNWKVQPEDQRRVDLYNIMVKLLALEGACGYVEGPRGVPVDGIPPLTHPPQTDQYNSEPCEDRPGPNGRGLCATVCEQVSGSPGPRWIWNRSPARLAQREVLAPVDRAG